MSWSAKIVPKLNKIWKTFRKQGFFDNFCSFLMVFYSFFNVGWIWALHLTRVDFGLVVQIFWHHWHPWGRVNSGVKQILVILNTLPLCPCGNFFLIFYFSLNNVYYTRKKKSKLIFPKIWYQIHFSTCILFSCLIFKISNAF